MSVNKSKLARSIMNRGQWSPQPNELWNMPISVKAKSAYCYLLAQSDSWNPGLKGIAAGISMSINSARAAIKELEDANMVIVEQSPNGLRNVYIFTGVDEWNCQATSNSARALTADFIGGTTSNSAGGTISNSAGGTTSNSAGAPYHPLHASKTNTIPNPIPTNKKERSVAKATLVRNRREECGSLKEKECEISLILPRQEEEEMWTLLLEERN